MGRESREPPEPADGPLHASSRVDVRSEVSLRELLRDFWLGQIDLAPLGLFRIAYGALLIVWFLQFAPDLRAFFTDDGFLPRRSVSAFWPDRWSVLFLVGEWWQVSAIWVLSVVAAILVTIGYRTRLACVLAFVAIVSFEHRNPLILSAADSVFRVIGFWLIFTAAGSQFSFDAALRRARGERVTRYGPAFPIRLLQLQVGWIYLATGLEKLPGQEWLQGGAVYYPLVHSFFGRAYARPLAELEPLVRSATWSTLLLEIGFLPATFLPFFQPHARNLAVLGAAMLQLGILVLMNVGNFPLIMLALLLLFLPPAPVRRAVRSGRHILDRFRITPIRLVGKRDLADAPFAASTQSAGSVALLAPAAIGSMPTIPHGAARLYALIARRRPPVATPPTETGRVRAAPARATAGSRRTQSHVQGIVPWGGPAFVVVLGVIAAMAFAAAMPPNLSWARPPAPIRSMVRSIGLQQRWNMFGPNPTRVEAWMQATGRLADGTRVDLVDHWGRPRPNSPTILSGPPDSGPRFSPIYTRWVKAHGAVTSTRYRREYARMYCRLHNRDLAPGSPPLERLDLIYTKRIIPRRGNGQPELRDESLGSYRC